MSGAIQTLFGDEQYCLDELLRIREAFGNKNTFNEKVIDASRKTLAFMMLYAPKSISSLIDATLYELEKREQYLFLGVTK